MRVYLDNAATTHMDPRVLEAMIPFFIDSFGNASSLHTYGREAAMGMATARAAVAELIGAKPDDIIFTAGGTESDNIALKGVALGPGNGKKHVITSSIEHPAIIDTCRYLEKRHGVRVTYLPVDGYGLVRPEDLEKAVGKDTTLISIMHANNEIGTIEPVVELGKIARKHGIPFHTDAVQSVGKVPIDVSKMNIDMLSLSSHKIHGPKGVGALYIRRGLKLETFVHGGGHERGLRSSTENVPGIVGLGKACELLSKEMDADIDKMTVQRDRLIKTVIERVEDCRLNGHTVNRLPNNCNFSFAAIEGESLVLSLDAKGIAASTGSACSSKKLEPSHVLKAIGLPDVDAHGSLRLTLSRETTDEEIDYVLEYLPPIVEKLRMISPLWTKTK